MPKAALIRHLKRFYDDGSILEVKLWALEQPVRGSSHRLKYSLFYGRAALRLVAYDNEAGKGDHRHVGDLEEAYASTTPERLVADFLADVEQLRGEAP